MNIYKQNRTIISTRDKRKRTVTLEDLKLLVDRAYAHGATGSENVCDRWMDSLLELVVVIDYKE